MSWDLASHVALAKALKDNLFTQGPLFYDNLWFSGWQAFSLYGVLPYLIASFISYPLSLFVNNPIETSVYLLNGLSLILLPIFIYNLISALSKANKTLIDYISLFAITIFLSCSIYFFPDQKYGLGFAGAWKTGMFAQNIAWNFLLIFIFYYLKFLDQSSTKPNKTFYRMSVISLSLLFYCHPFTYTYLVVFILISGLMLDSVVKSVKVILHSILLNSYLLLPALLNLNGDFPLDPFPNTSDLFVLLMKGVAGSTNWLSLAILAILFGIICSVLIKKTYSLPSVLAISAILSLLVVSSKFWIQQLSLSLHLYRYSAVFVFLFLISLFSILCQKVSSLKHQWLKYGILLVIGGLSVIRLIDGKNEIRSYLKIVKEQNIELSELISELDQIEKRGRIVFEHDKTNLTPVSNELSARYVVSSNNESLNSIFVQSSLASKYINFALIAINYGAYHTPVFFKPRGAWSFSMFLKKLEQLNLEHIVASHRATKKMLRQQLGEPILKSSQWEVFRTRLDKFSHIEAVSKPVVGYYDSKGNLPFDFLQMYFYSSSLLSENVELLEIKDKELSNLEIFDLVLYNVKSEAMDTESDSLRFNFITKSNSSSLNKRAVDYKLLVKLFSKINLESKVLDRLKSYKNNIHDNQKPELEYNNGKFVLNNLNKNTLYKINYSYSPFFISHNKEALLFRGMPERIYFFSTQKSHEIVFSPFSHKLLIFGLFLSILGMIILVYSSKQKNEK